MAVHLSGASIPWRSAGEGIERAILFGEKLSAALYTCPPGYVSTPEEHPEEQVVYMAAGTTEWLVGPEGAEQCYLCGLGSLLIIGPNERHWSRVVGDSAALEITLFGPPREAHRELAAVTRGHDTNRDVTRSRGAEAAQEGKAARALED